MKKLFLFLALLSSPIFALNLPLDFVDGNPLPASSLNLMLTARSSHLLPINSVNSSSRTYLSSTYDLGSSTYKWRDLWLSRSGYFATSVGIGTTSPATTLQVTGTANITQVLGVGTTAPSVRLHVVRNSTGGNIAKFGSGVASGDAIGTLLTDSGRTYFGIDSSNGSGSALPLAISLGGSEYARLNTTGLGIGTNSPSYKLHVVGESYFTGRATFAGNELFCGDGTSDVFYRWRGPNNWELVLDNTNDKLQVRRNSVSSTTFQSDGSVGIGTASPAAKLHVVGTLTATGRATFTGNEVFCGDGASDATFRWSGSNNWEFKLFNSSEYVLFQRNSVEFLRINSTGQVSVGGEPQSGYGITVANSTGLYIDANSGSNGLMVKRGSSLFFNFNTDSTTQYMKYGASPVDFQVNGTTYMRIPSASAGLNLGTGKLFFGSSISGQDTNLYRSAADTLKTDDSLVVGTTLYLGNTDTNIYRSAADTVKTDDSLVVGAELTVNTQPRCRVYNSSSQSIADSTSTTLTFDTEEYDDGGCHSTSSNTSRLTAPSAGMYLVTARVTFQSTSGTGDRIVYLLKNGTTFDRASQMSVPASKTIEITITSQLKLTAGDYVEVQAYQSSGGSINAVGNTIPYEPTNFSFVKLN